jgi:hypothetical protein
MNAEKFRVLTLAAVLLLTGDLPAQDKKPAAKPEAAKSLIRKEWLQVPAVPAAPPRRDIFSAFGGFTPGAAEATTQIPVNKKTPETQIEEAPPVLALRYIGYSRASGTKKIVALVMVDAQASAVEEGETLPQGYKVVRITVKEIEVQGPDGKSVTFALEGAER